MSHFDAHVVRRFLLLAKEFILDQKRNKDAGPVLILSVVDQLVEFVAGENLEVRRPLNGLIS